MSDQTELPFSGAELRDAGIARVLGHNAPWASRAHAYFLTWLGSKPTGFEFIGEDFILAAEVEVGSPSHPNAWGGLFSGFCKTGLIRNSGQCRATRHPDSHARRSFVYAKL